MGLLSQSLSFPIYKNEEEMWMGAMFLNPGRFWSWELEKVKINLRKTQFSGREQCHLPISLCTCNLQITANAIECNLVFIEPNSIIKHCTAPSRICSDELSTWSSSSIGDTWNVHKALYSKGDMVPSEVFHKVESLKPGPALWSCDVSSHNRPCA